MRSFITVLFTKYWGNQIKGEEMSGACSMHGRDEKCIHLVGKHEGKRSHGRHRLGGRIALE
jgi:hypothetical protein